jgi:hypothetical protein
MYALAGLSLLRLRGRFATPPARALAVGIGLAAVACALAMIASGSRLDWLITLATAAVAAALYLWMRRR